MRSRVIRLVKLWLGEEFVALRILGEFYVELNLILAVFATSLDFYDLFLGNDAPIFRHLATYRLKIIIIVLLHLNKFRLIHNFFLHGLLFGSLHHQNTAFIFYFVDLISFLKGLRNVKCVLLVLLHLFYGLWRIHNCQHLRSYLNNISLRKSPRLRFFAWRSMVWILEIWVELGAQRWSTFDEYTV